MPDGKYIARLILSGLAGAALTAFIFLGCLFNPLWHFGTALVGLSIISSILYAAGLVK